MARDDNKPSTIENYFKEMVELEASDLYLTTGAIPHFRIEGELTYTSQHVLLPGETERFAKEILDEEQWEDFHNGKDINLAQSLHGVGRYRINVFKQRNQIALVIRSIKQHVQQPHELGIPNALTKLFMQKSGLFLVCGPTNSGKSTTVASLIDYRGSHKTEHIITIEDPIEYLHRHERSLINQREVGIDTVGFEAALENSLRQTPDVVFIGETRSAVTMQEALKFADTGHFCITTLHATNSIQAIERVLSFFPKDERDHILNDLSLNLRGIVVQRLVPSLSGKRCAVFEILSINPLARDEIKRGNLQSLRTIMEKSPDAGMQSFDDALFKLCRQGLIAEDVALSNADSVNDLRIRLAMIGDKRNDDKDSDGISLVNADDEFQDDNRGQVF